MWRTVIQTRQPLETTWHDAFPTWFGTPNDPFWWSYYPVEEADEYVASLLETVPGVELREVADSDVEAPRATDAGWRWATLTVEQMRNFPQLDDDVDNHFLDHFKEELVNLQGICKPEGIQVRVVLYCAPNCSERISMIDENGKSFDAVYCWSLIPH